MFTGPHNMLTAFASNSNHPHMSGRSAVLNEVLGPSQKYSPNLSHSIAAPPTCTSVNITAASTHGSTAVQTFSLCSTTGAPTQSHVESSRQRGHGPYCLVSNPQNGSEFIPRMQTHLDAYIEHIRTSEWHEAPSPRLFIVIPYGETQENYRFYWLCEYFDSHNRPIPHLIGNPWFELDKPKEFFMMYGETLLLSLLLFKASKTKTDQDNWFSYSDGIDTLHMDLDMSEEDIETSLDLMIVRVQQYIPISSEPSVVWEAISRVPCPAKQDLYGIQSFFITTQNNVRTSMENHHGHFRSVGKEGHVQWICASHFNICHESLDPRKMNTLLHDYGGAYNDRRGLITARLCSGTLAHKLKYMYDSEIGTKGCVSELSLHLGWDATDHDLDDISSCVSSMNMVSVVLTSKNFCQNQSSISQLIKSILLRDEIRIQSFGLGNLCDHRKQVNSVWLTKRSASRKSLWLALDAEKWGRSRVKRDFIRAIREQGLQVACDTLEQMPYLEASLRNLAAGFHEKHTVTFASETQVVVLTIDERGLQDMELKVTGLANVDRHPLVRSGHIQTLTIIDSIDMSDPGTQADILRVLSVGCSLVSLIFCCMPTDFRRIEHIMRKVISKAERCHLKKFVLQDITSAGSDIKEIYECAQLDLKLEMEM
ncbi:hypothetical protein BGX28_002394 [Mortierella sp. GBA30]|nr:hypothetical protein BGX28_002394 [Mortierella sp. GBA30]